MQWEAEALVGGDRDGSTNSTIESSDGEQFESSGCIAIHSDPPQGNEFSNRRAGWLQEKTNG
jgi:hypothetical protein